MPMCQSLDRERQKQFSRFSVFGFRPPATNDYTQPLKPSRYSMITYKHKYIPHQLLPFPILYRCASHSTERDKNSFPTPVASRRFSIFGHQPQATTHSHWNPRGIQSSRISTHTYLSQLVVVPIPMCQSFARERQNSFPGFSVFGFRPPATSNYTQPLKLSRYSIITNKHTYIPLPACSTPYTDVSVTRARETKQFPCFSVFGHKQLLHTATESLTVVNHQV